jgi:hypothetical protein
MKLIRWGSGKSFLIDLIKREFDPHVREGDLKLVQKFEVPESEPNKGLWLLNISILLSFQTNLK